MPLSKIQSDILRGRLADALFPVMENVDIAGIPGSIPSKRRASRNVAFRVTVRGEKT